MAAWAIATTNTRSKNNSSGVAARCDSCGDRAVMRAHHRHADFTDEIVFELRPGFSSGFYLRHASGTDRAHDLIGRLAMAERSIADIDLRAITARAYFPSPFAWEDEVL